MSQADRWRKFVHETIRGEIFRVDFVKRTTGEDRRMVCRAGVKKGVQNPGQFVERDRRAQILRVFDCQKKQFRSIPLDRVKCLRWRGKDW
jgi:hypothetical protein